MTQRVRAISIEAAVIVMLLLEGCARFASLRATVPHVDARRLANLRALAEQDMACPSADLSIWSIDDRVWQVSGCGHAREYTIRSHGFGARWERIESVGVRASDELGCSASLIALRVETHGVMNASGCGRSTVLQLQCDIDRCEWTAIARVEEVFDAGVPASVPAAPVSTALILNEAPSALPTPSSSPIIVVPDISMTDPNIELALRNALDSDRVLVLACGASGALIRGSWSHDRVVRFSLDPPWAGTESERCLQSSLPTYHVVSSRPGEITHVIR
jgi:hypothetical protein